LPINDRRVEKRAFVPVDSGAVMIYEFGLTWYHSMMPKLFEDQLRTAKPIDATAGEPLNGGSRNA
jgi:hypothetical protein